MSPPPERLNLSKTEDLSTSSLSAYVKAPTLFLVSLLMLWGCDITFKWKGITKQVLVDLGLKCLPFIFSGHHCLLDNTVTASDSFGIPFRIFTRWVCAVYLSLNPSKYKSFNALGALGALAAVEERVGRGRAVAAGKRTRDQKETTMNDAWERAELWGEVSSSLDAYGFIRLMIGNMNRAIKSGDLPRREHLRPSHTRVQYQVRVMISSAAPLNPAATDLCLGGFNEDGTPIFQPGKKKVEEVSKFG